MAFFKRLFGISDAQRPQDPTCWSLSGKEVRVDLTKLPDLKQPGGAIRLEGKGLKDRILLFYGDDQMLHAFHNKCACAGFRLDHQPGTSMVQCATLGKSTYDYTGNMISGSAKHPVKTFEVREEGNEVVIELDEA